jgi:hypothetical protein
LRYAAALSERHGNCSPYCNSFFEDGLRLLAKFEVAREILIYLEEHPDAQDTFDGIVDWWLLERRISYQILVVREAVQDLVRSGLVLEVKMESGVPRYRINRDKFGEHQKPDDMQSESGSL